VEANHPAIMLATRSLESLEGDVWYSYGSATASEVYVHRFPCFYLWIRVICDLRCCGVAGRMGGLYADVVIVVVG
jgi:hypothetical protein